MKFASELFGVISKNRLEIIVLHIRKIVYKITVQSQVKKKESQKTKKKIWIKSNFSLCQILLFSSGFECAESSGK